MCATLPSEWGFLCPICIQIGKRVSQPTMCVISRPYLLKYLIDLIICVYGTGLHAHSRGCAHDTVTELSSPVLKITSDRFISYRFLSDSIRSCTAHSIPQLHAESLLFSVSSSLCCCADPGPLKGDDDRSVYSTSQALQGHSVEHTKPTLHFLGSFCPIKSYLKAAFPRVLSSWQRDAQVARREPKKAFGHQPAAQTAQIPGGGRGHQRGPQVFALSGGHQQCVHRGEDTAHHRILWIPALGQL